MGQKIYIARILKDLNSAHKRELDNRFFADIIGLKLMVESVDIKAEGTVAIISVWKQDQRVSFKAWMDFFSERINGQEFSDILALLDVAKSAISVKTIYPEQDGHIGKPEQWLFLQPIHDPASLLSLIDDLSFPDLKPQIDNLAAVLRLEPDLLLQGIIQTNALLDATKFPRLPALGEDLGARTASLALTDGKHMRLNRFSPPHLTENGLMGAVVGYYGLVRIRGQDCHSLIFAQGLSAIDFTILFPWVLLFSSHAAVGDAYYNSFLQQERFHRQ